MTGIGGKQKHDSCGGQRVDGRIVRVVNGLPLCLSARKGESVFPALKGLSGIYCSVVTTGVDELGVVVSSMECSRAQIPCIGSPHHSTIGSSSIQLLAWVVL